MCFPVHGQFDWLSPAAPSALCLHHSTFLVESSTATCQWQRCINTWLKQEELGKRAALQRLAGSRGGSGGQAVGTSGPPRCRCRSCQSAGDSCHQGNVMSWVSACSWAGYESVAFSYCHEERIPVLLFKQQQCGDSVEVGAAEIRGLCFWLCFGRVRSLWAGSAVVAAL